MHINSAVLWSHPTVNLTRNISEEVILVFNHKVRTLRTHIILAFQRGPGLKIMAGQQTMSGLIGELTGQPFVLPIMLTGHIRSYWKWINLKFSCCSGVTDIRVHILVVTKLKLFSLSLVELFGSVKSGKINYCFRKRSAKSLQSWIQKCVRNMTKWTSVPRIYFFLIIYYT